MEHASSSLSVHQPHEVWGRFRNGLELAVIAATDPCHYLYRWKKDGIMLTSGKGKCLIFIHQPEY